MILFQCTIPGRPIVKKNTQRVIGSGMRKHVIYSPRYRSWEQIAIAACNRAFKPPSLACPLEANFRFYFENRQAEADTSNLIEGVQDVLTKTRVIKDDKQIIRIVAEKYFGEEPRVEVELKEFDQIHETNNKRAAQGSQPCQS